MHNKSCGKVQTSVEREKKWSLSAWFQIALGTGVDLIWRGRLFHNLLLKSLCHLWPLSEAVMSLHIV